LPPLVGHEAGYRGRAGTGLLGGLPGQGDEDEPGHHDRGQAQAELGRAGRQVPAIMKYTLPVTLDTGTTMEARQDCSATWYSSMAAAEQPASTYR
jgi:hypothetical protein